MDKVDGYMEPTLHKTGTPTLSRGGRDCAGCAVLRHFVFPQNINRAAHNPRNLLGDPVTPACQLRSYERGAWRGRSLSRFLRAR